MSGGLDVDVRVDKSLAVPGDGVVASCCRERPVMELHLAMLRGSPGPLFEFTAAGAHLDAVTMDAEVWSKMPEELLWEVVRFVPAAKLFQLQLVSRQWGQELTSVRFRKRLVTEESWEQRQQQERVVVACVSPPSSRRRPQPRSASGSRSSAVDCGVDCEANVLSLDLGFVPSWFWSSFWGWGSYGVVATGHGMVCISNRHELPHETKKSAEEAREREADRYCVLNPLTRTCIVLPPKLPFQPHTWFLPDSATLAIYSSSSDTTGRACRRLATYDLAAGAGGGAGWVRTHTLVTSWPCDYSWWSPGEALMPHDQSAAQGPSRPHPHVRGYVTRAPEHTVVVAHRGELYLVRRLFVASDQAAHATSRQDAMCDVSVWRGADRGGGKRGPEWEDVALLDARSEIERLTPGLTCVASIDLRATYAVRQFVCFELECAQLEKRVE